MIMKCDICKQEELIPDSLIGDREITGGIRHSDWKICLKQLIYTVGTEQESHKKTAKHLVDQRSYADCLEIKFEKLNNKYSILKIFLEKISYNFKLGKHCNLEILKSSIDEILRVAK